MTEIGTYLWFKGQAEEAANFYVNLFENSQIVDWHGGEIQATDAGAWSRRSSGGTACRTPG
ncbi:VOC family protein [Paeniglutamicibacter antarcticus]|uniref:VOC family protein n=1 Tax=Arthrobacter terrae TaxID=2935737 RepID=A0A931G6S2_9MICC|nr:VOC family protein [Arthrobacter terrae]MBG0741358.1 VOC family protein [Arthrobacter terrae]